MTTELIATIRDVSIIALTVCLTVALILWTVWLFRLYRSAKRTVRNVEDMALIVRERVVEPLTTIPPLMEIAQNALGFVQRLVSRERRNEEDDRD